MIQIMFEFNLSATPHIKIPHPMCLVQSTKCVSVNIYFSWPISVNIYDYQIYECIFIFMGPA